LLQIPVQQGQQEQSVIQAQQVPKDPQVMPQIQGQQAQQEQLAQWEKQEQLVQGVLLVMPQIQEQQVVQVLQVVQDHVVCQALLQTQEQQV
jgi:hypothetical protein